MAAKCCSFDIIKCLVEHGADINAREGKQGRTVLHKACEDGNDELVLFLLSECRATLDLEAENYARLTAYQVAAINSTYNQKYLKIVQALVSAGAEEAILPIDDSDSEAETDIPMPAVHKLYNDNNCTVNVA